MTNNNEVFHALDETVDNIFNPIATSTGIKDKTKKNIDVDLQNSVQFYEERINKCYLTKKNNNSKSSNVEMSTTSSTGTGVQYLYYREKPVVRKEMLFTDNEESIVEKFENRKKTYQNLEPRAHSTLLEAEASDKEYFNKHTGSIQDLTILSAQSAQIAKNDRNIDLLNKENNAHSTSMLDQLDMSQINQFLDETNLCNITKLAYGLVGTDNAKITSKIFKESDIHNEKVRTPNSRDSFRLLSNKDSLLWIGVAVKNNESKGKHEHIMDWLHCNRCIKSFTLNLQSPCPLQAKITIVQSFNVFHLTNQSGSEFHQTKEVTLTPLHDRKFFVVFNPTDSAYHNESIVVQVDSHKFKIRLFGYAEPAKVELLNFRVLNDQGGPEKQIYVRGCHGKDFHNQIIRVFNSGARTAFVSFYSYQQDVRFQPHWFLLIPKTTMDIKVSSTSDDDITFFVIHTDEELRRACRTSSYAENLARHDYFSVLETLQIFTKLPDEKNSKTHKLPKHDWRPYLLNQISSSYRDGSIVMISKASSQSKVPMTDGNRSSQISCTSFGEDNESVCTIDKRSKSSATALSSVSIIDKLNSRTVYMNSTANIFHSVNQTLPGVVVLRDVVTFPATVVNKVSYSAVLIRNNNWFPVSWFVSNMVLISSNTLNVESCRNSPVDTNSIYSLTSTPMYNPASSITVTIAKGTLQPYTAVVVPVQFRPLNTGQVECKCTVTAFKDSQDCFFEKDIDFIGEAIRRKDSTSGTTSSSSGGDTVKIPGFSVSPNVINFRNVPIGRYVEMRIQLKNSTNHVKDIFMNDVSRPFEIRSSQMSLERGKSLISVFFDSKHKGLFEETLLFSDDEGFCTSVLLKAQSV